MPFGAFFGQPAADAGGAGAAQPGAAGAAAQDPGAALGLPAAMAWWNTLQEQFTPAVTTALTPTDGAAGAANPANPAGTAAQGDAQVSPQAEPGAGAGGNGKARAGKPKADKG